MTDFGYALEPAAGLDGAGLDGVRRIYEDGFPERMRADFASLTDGREQGEEPLAMMRGGQPLGFVMLRALGPAGWTYLRYFVVDEARRGQGLGQIMWQLLAGRLRAAGSPLLVFDVEDPDEDGCDAAEKQIRSRRIAFYQRQGAVVLPVSGYQAPHGEPSEGGWAPMVLMAAALAPGARPPGAAEAEAIVAAVHEHRWGLEPGHPRRAGVQVPPGGC